MGDKVITVLDDPDKEYTVKLHYEGRVKEVKIKQDVKYGSLFDQIGNYFSLKAKSFYTLCNGVLVGDDDDDLEKSISQLSNTMNKETNEINLLIEANDSFLEEENNEINSDNKIEQKSPKTDEIKAQEIKLNERKKVAKFLFKIYVKLLVQFSLIGFFVCLGFYKKYDKIFIGKFKNMTYVFEILFIIYITIFIFKYKKNKCYCFTIFHILIYIPFMIILCFLLSTEIDKDNILSFIFLIVIDIISVILFLLIFKRNRGYGILLLSLVLNAIYILPLYIIYYEYNFENIYVIFNIASILIFYVLFFNNISKKKLDEDEGVVAVYFFDYYFFLPFSITFLIVFVSAIVVPLGLIVLASVLILFFIILSVISYFGAGIILFFVTIKVFFSLCCKSRKAK